jgi:hypothetical protein
MVIPTGEGQVPSMKHDAAKQAVANLDAALVTRKQFPENIFLGKWDSFFFFDPDYIFEAPFVEVVKTLMESENGRCACLRNLDIMGSDGSLERSLLFLDRETTGEAYQAFLAGPAPGMGWLHMMFRYACASDAGSWCIYCERNNEIAVIAVRRMGNLSLFNSAISSLHALPIEQAIEKPPSYGLSSRSLSVEWRNRLLEEYDTAMS